MSVSSNTPPPPKKIPPKKRPTRETPAEGSSQGAEGHVLTTTTEANNPTTQLPHPTHPHTSIEFHNSSIDAGRPEGPTGQPSTQYEAFTTDAAVPNPLPSSSWQHRLHNQDPHQQIKTLEDVQQDSEEEIESVIEDELAHLRLVYEKMTKQRAVMKRAQIM
jgi:hypothetical protein